MERTLLYVVESALVTALHGCCYVTKETECMEVLLLLGLLRSNAGCSCTVKRTLSKQ